MLIVRPSKISDLNAFIDLKDAAGSGFTSLAVHDSDLKARLQKSAKSFRSQGDTSGNSIYLLMLEDSNTGEIVGVSAVKSQVGVGKPFFSFKILNLVQSSSAADRHFNMEIMLLVNEYSGASEVGTLFVKQKMRGTGAGRLISQARYMLIAAAPNLFADTVISELRGRVDEQGYSPFWEGMGRKFFKMDFNEADEITAKTNNQFITDLMPRYPIYVDLLPDEARQVIGQCHPDGLGAKRLLEDEGFRYEKFVDIFDAGPTLEVRKNQIRTVKDSQLFKVRDGDQGKSRALMSNNRINDFRAVFTRATVEGDGVILTSEVRKALRVKVNEQVRVFLS
ncbi:MAG: arginine N-succinyltransferase [Hyphomonadaceae bacterium]|nr:arginine N-succinyltransferase [Hyphomonadaceae bacterium]